MSLNCNLPYIERRKETESKMKSIKGFQMTLFFLIIEVPFCLHVCWCGFHAVHFSLKILIEVIIECLSDSTFSLALGKKGNYQTWVYDLHMYKTGWLDNYHKWNFDWMEMAAWKTGLMSASLTVCVIAIWHQHYLCVTMKHYRQQGITLIVGKKTWKWFMVMEEGRYAEILLFNIGSSRGFILFSKKVDRREITNDYVNTVFCEKGKSVMQTRKKNLQFWSSALMLDFTLILLHVLYTS